MIIYTTEDFKSAYSIDDEGTLYYTPISESGAIRLDDWVDVDFYSIDEDLIVILRKMVGMNRIKSAPRRNLVKNTLAHSGMQMMEMI